MPTIRARGGVCAIACTVTAALVGASSVGCTTGSVDIVLDMPAKAELAPAGAATITLVAQQPGTTPVATTSVIADDGTFDLGKLPVVSGLALSVVLRSQTQRVVGYGRAAAPVDVDARDIVEVDVPMRRPFAYVTGPSAGVAAMDTTLDATQKYQSTISINGGAALIAASGGDVWSIASSGHAARISGATHAPDGATLTLAGGVRDAIASSDGRFLIAATTSGLSIADTGSGMVTDVPVNGGVDRVAIGATAEGGVRVVGLSGRRTTGDCPQAAGSKIVMVSLGDTIGAPLTQDPKVPLADLAGSESAVDLVGVDPCGNALLRLTADGEIATSTKLASVPSPTAAAMFGDHAWALGSVPGIDDGSGVITTPAHMVLVDSAVDGSSSTRADLAGIQQTAHGFDRNGVDLVLSRDMEARSVTADDLVVVPPGDQIALVFSAHFDAPELTDGIQTVIPMMTADTAEYELLNATGGAVVQRLLAQCNLMYDGTQAAVPMWKCEPAAGAAWPDSGAEFMPGNLAVLFGGR